MVKDGSLGYRGLDVFVFAPDVNIYNRNLFVINSSE